MRQFAVTRCDIDGIPADTRVEVIALSITGTGRTLVSIAGRTIRLAHEALIELV